MGVTLNLAFEKKGGRILGVPCLGVRGSLGPPFSLTFVQGRGSLIWKPHFGPKDELNALREPKDSAMVRRGRTGMGENV
jgi:hypothetical protein